jgi:galactokinase
VTSRARDRDARRARATALAADPAGLAAALADLDPTAASDPSRIRVVRAPGRVNLIGDHTDYNLGLALPCAIDLGIAIALVPTGDRRVRLTLAATGEAGTIDLDRIGPRGGTWIDYVAGIAWAMQEAGVATSGFTGLLAADLPQGSGLSSSAALEVVAAWALAGGVEPPVDPMRLVHLVQRGENGYIGLNNGIMDQFASIFGQPGAALLLDCRSLEHRPVRLPLDEVALVVCHSGSTRRLDASGYNERRAQCEAAVAMIAGADPSVRSLRDVNEALLDRVGDRLDPLLRARAHCVVSENARVLETVSALEAGDVVAAGHAFIASHASLRDEYEVSSPELDALVEIATAVPGVLGARLTGAGFGGCTVNLVRRDAVGRLRAAIEREYPARTGLRPRVFEVAPAAGAGVSR